MRYLEQKGTEGILLTVYVQPKASRNTIAGEHGDALKIRITAPPIDGKANAALIKFLAKLFHLPKAAVILQSGQQSRTKRFLLVGLCREEAEKIVRPALAGKT